MSFFSNEQQMNNHNNMGQRECIIENLDVNLPTMGTVQITESNNDDFNYSESNY